MFIAILTLLSALSISGVAIFYSVIGLATIFPGAFWPVVKQQVAGGGGGRGGLSGPLRSTRPLIEITNEDCREMLVCNRDFFLAWLAESHGDCVMHVRHVDGSFCFMSLTESFRNVKLGI